MCGIVGITSGKPVTSSIINSLRKLEYRGYDSAGIATLDNGFINEVKCEGRVDNLEKNLSKKKMNKKNFRIFVAANLGTTRLIDNYKN